MYDIQLIKTRINCVEVAKRCGLPILKSGDRCVSPLREGATNASSFYVSDDFWFDFGDARGGDAIDLLAELNYSGDKGAAIRELARMTGVNNDSQPSDEWFTYTQNLCNQIAFWQTQLTEDDREYLHSRGLTDATIEALRIGRTEEGRLSIPYLKNGYVAYYCTRHLPGGAYPESKYRKQRKDGMCEHIVWGLDSLARGGDTLVIAEGAFDAISFYQEGYPVISAITGFFSRDQITTVISAVKHFDRVFIVYDDDSKTSNAGAKFTERMSQLLTRNRIPFIVGTVPIPFHDISEYYAAGGDLQRIIDSAQDGVQYIASTYRNFDDLERYVYTVARHTKRSRLDALQQHLIRTSDFDRRLIDNLFRAATTAPPETIITDEILSEHNLVYVPSVGFYEYLSGVWQRQPDDIIRGYADRAYGEFSTANRVNAICNLLRVRAIQDVSFDRAPVWNFINGTLDLETGVFRDHNPSDYCSVQASYPYNPTATAPAWEQFISDVTGDDPKTSELLQFIPGYALFHNCPHEKIFALTGSGGNGKSVYLAVLRQLFGEDNVSYLQPRALLKDFQRIKLRSSIINIAGEIKSNLTEVEELLKSIASGEPQTACYKGKDYVDFIPRTKLLFACNGQLQSGDTSDGLTRRLVLIDFKMRFVDNPNPGDYYERQKDIHILEKLSAEIQSGAVFNWVYAGYQMLRAVGYFTETADQLVLLEDFKRASNPILLFYEDMERKPEYGNSEIYRDYRQWCDDNGHRATASNSFHREFKRVAEQEYEPFRTNKNRGYRLK